MQLVFLRHGETDYNVVKRLQGSLDTPLNANGERQAMDVSKYFSLSPGKTSITLAFSSDLQRAFRTAELVLPPGTPITKLPGFKERQMGELEGMLLKDAQELAQKQGKQVNMYGEDHITFEARLLGAYDNLLNSLEDVPNESIVLVVSHGGALRTLMPALVRTGRVITSLSAGDVSKSHQNCSISVIENGKLIRCGDKLTEALQTTKDLL